MLSVRNIFGGVTTRIYQADQTRILNTSVLSLSDWSSSLENCSVLTPNEMWPWTRIQFSSRILQMLTLLPSWILSSGSTVNIAFSPSQWEWVCYSFDSVFVTSLVSFKRFIIVIQTVITLLSHLIIVSDVSTEWLLVCQCRTLYSLDSFLAYHQY